MKARITDQDVIQYSEACTRRDELLALRAEQYRAACANSDDSSGATPRDDGYDGDDDALVPEHFELEDGADQDELELLETLIEGMGRCSGGEAISDGHFVTAMREGANMVSDTRHVEDYVDWARYADACKQDYTDIGPRGSSWWCWS